MTNALDAGTGTVFGGLSALRRARIFHPDGVASTAEVTVEPGDHPLDVLAGDHDAVVRISRAIGLPERFPDILGLAVKVLDAHGPGTDQDFLLVTSGGGFPGHHLLLPTRSVTARPYSSLLPLRDARGERFLVGALPDDASGRSFALAVANVRGPWQPVGTVRLGDDLPPDAGQRLQFTPWHTGGGLRPSGLLNRLRRGAYAGSQQARPDTAEPERDREIQRVR